MSTISKRTAITVLELANELATLSAADWNRMKALVTDSERERDAVIILACCARVMRDGDPLTRMQAHDVHEHVLRWVWGHQATKSWKGTYTGEVL